MVIEPRLLALSTAVPEHVLHQSEVRARVRRVFGQQNTEIDRLAPLFDNAGIATRYACMPIDWYELPHGWTERNSVYVEHAVTLLERVARDCLARAGLQATDIDSIVVVSTTGISTPSLDAILLNRLGLRSDVRRLPIFGLGCAGGVLGLARAGELARGEPGGNVLLLVVELCSLCFREVDRSKANIVATALFGDGAAGAILSCRGAGPRLGPTGEHTWPDSLDIMGWEVAEDGLQVLFSRDIPTLVRSQFRAAADGFLARHGLTLGDIGGYACHPGGAKVVTALEAAFDLADGTLTEARRVLAAYGNMSAPTVMFVLKGLLDRGLKRRMLLTALGPGFSAAFAILDSR